MSWNKTGTVSVTQGSNAVLGTGTRFLQESRVGDGFRGPDGAWYEVINIASDTAMAIDPAYAGATVADATFTVAPLQGYPKLLSDRVNEYLDRADTLLIEAEEFMDTAQASAAQAAASAQAAQDSESAAAASKTAAAASEVAADASEAAAAASEAAALASKNAAAVSEAAADASEAAAAGSAADALASKNAAASSQADALASKNAAEGSATAAAASQADALASKNAAAASQADALASKNAAAASQADALASKNAAAGSVTAAAASQADALASKNAAAGSATAAQTAETKAKAWASNPENSVVETGLYSARHYAIKAQASADAAGATIGPRLNSIAQAVMAVNDMLIADSSSTMVKIATGAFGRSSLLGAATMADARVALAVHNVDNTSDANKPISSATATALAGKLNLSGGTLTGPLRGAPIATVASAATVNLGAQSSNVVQITGAAAISSFGSIAGGAEVTVLFSGVMTLVHGGNLVLPGDVNLVTAVDDVGRFVSTSPGAWYCTDYYPKNGQPVKTVSIAKGGTGATSISGAQAALGLVPAATPTPDTIVLRNLAGAVETLSLEIGKRGTADVPYLDFHSGSPDTDFDSRITASGGTGVAGQGSLNFYAAAFNFYGATPTFRNGNVYVNAASAAGNSALWLNGENGQTRALMYATPENNMVIQTGAVTAFSFTPTGCTANGTLTSIGTMNGVGGVYDNSNRVWSTGNFNPNKKMAAIDTLTLAGQYNSNCGPIYNTLGSTQQVYNGGVEMRENGLVASGGPSPGHIFNAPAVVFHWSGYNVRKLMMNNSGAMCWGDPNSEYFQISTSGNISGTAYGGPITDWLAKHYLNKANLMLQSVSATFSGQVGGYALMKNVTAAPIGVNDVIPSSSLVWSDASLINYGGASAGTYRSLGYTGAGYVGIFMRIA